MYLKGHFGGKTSLNPKPFLINTIQNGLEHKKLMVIKSCSAICHVIFDFDNLTIPYLVIWEIFWQTVAYCAVNVPHQTKNLVCRDSDQKY